MKRLTVTLVSASSIGLAAAAFAAPTAAPPEATATCPTPDKATCESNGYIETSCGRKHLDTCKPYVVAKLKEHHEAAGAPTVKMLRPKKYDIPTDVKVGSYYAYKPKSGFASAFASRAKAYKVKIVKPKSTGKTASAQQPVFAKMREPYSKAAPVDSVTHVDPNLAAKAHRTPAWDENGATIATCEEYGYEANYDAMRFLDAAAACRGDRECVFDVAYMAATPGIATRALKDKNGVTLAHQIEMVTGKFPKNDLFVAGAAFVRSNGFTPLADTPEILELEAALTTGAEYYSIGSCSGTACNRVRKFKNEWDWHSTLHDKNSALTLNEQEEFERRRAQFRDLLQQLDAARTRESDLLDQTATSKQPVLPYDEQTYDPFERYERASDLVRPGEQLIKQLEKKFGKGMWNKSMEQLQSQGALEPTYHRGKNPAAMLGLLASPTSTQQQPTPTTTKPSNTPKAQKGKTKGADNPCARAGGWGLELGNAGPISCRIGMFLRSEWARKKAGKRSCLDLGDTGCDWWPAMFEARMVSRVPVLDRQQIDLDDCNTWKDGSTLPANTVASVRSKLRANQAALEAIWKDVKEYDLGKDTNGRRLGKTWRDADYGGDKDWFAAGWHYDVGWTVESLKKENDNVCEVAGDMHADTGFDAWVFDHKVEVVRGEVRARANHDGDHAVTQQVHVEILGKSIYNKPEGGGWATVQTFNPDPKSGSFLKIPDPAIHFYIGAYISGKLWGELMQGVQLKSSGSATTSCDAEHPTFGLNSTYTPLFGAYAMSQVGAGIAEIASAGVRVSLNLVMIGLPVSVNMGTRQSNGAQVIGFNSKIAATIASLSGRMSAYIEIWPFDEEWEIFRWKGLGPVEIPLMKPLHVDVPIVGLK